MNHPSGHHVGLLCLQRDTAAFKESKNQPNETITAWKNSQVMSDLKDFECLPQRKHTNEIMIEAHKAVSGLEIRNFHSPHSLTQAQEGIG